MFKVGEKVLLKWSGGKNGKQSYPPAQRYVCIKSIISDYIIRIGTVVTLVPCNEKDWENSTLKDLITYAQFYSHRSKKNIFLNEPVIFTPISDYIDFRWVGVVTMESFSTSIQFILDLDESPTEKE